MKDIPRQVYVYRAKPIRVVDGDTIDVTIDMGFRVYRDDRLRLLGVNAPERKTGTMEAGNAARDYVVWWLQLEDSIRGLALHVDPDWPLLVETSKSDVFGRWLAYVWGVNSEACLNDDLVANGHAVPFMVDK